jgi:hypothetical protein
VRLVVLWHRPDAQDALKHVLSVGPMPKHEKPAKPRKKKTARKKR